MTNIDPNKPGTDPSQVSGPARMIAGYAITNALTYAAAKGLITEEQVGPITSWILSGLPYLVIIGHIIYYYINNTKSALVSRVQAMSKVQVVTTDPTLKTVPGVIPADANAAIVTVPVPKT